jgi:DivIVA domain-containing protein
VQQEGQGTGTEENLHAASVRKLRRAHSRGRRDSLVPKLSGRDFPVVFRGYDRAAVDAFLRELSAAVAELETRQSSDAVIQSALEEVGEQTSAILQRAHQSAEEITARSRATGAERVRQAEREAEAIVREAEERVRELDLDGDRMWQDRGRLIEDMRQLAEEILGVADDALDRYESPFAEHEEPTEEAEVTADDEHAEGEPTAEAEVTADTQPVEPEQPAEPQAPVEPQQPVEPQPPERP